MTLYPECYFETGSELVCVFVLPPDENIPEVDGYSMASEVRNGQIDVVLKAGGFVIPGEILDTFLRKADGEETKIVLVARPWGMEKAEVIGAIIVNRDFRIEYTSIRKFLEIARESLLK